MTGNDYALQLIVGVQDLFTQKAKKIEAQTNELDKEFKSLQKSAADVTAYKKMNRELESLENATDTTTKQIKAQEREIDKLANNLRAAGVDVKKLADEEARLEKQIRATDAAARKSQGLKDLVAGGVGAVAGVAMSKRFLAAGDDTNKLERMMAAQTGTSMEVVGSKENRAFRAKLQKQYGYTAGEVMSTQTLFHTQGQLTGDKNNQAVTAALQLQKINPEYSMEEIVRAMAPAIKRGYSPSEVAATINQVKVKGGDNAGDLLDTFYEYFSNLSRGARMSLQQFSATLVAGQQAGAYNYDKTADALKEMINARMSDPDMFKNLVGKNAKDPGSIGLIPDKGLQQKFRTAAYQYRGALSNGENLTPYMAKLFGLLDEVEKKYPGAARNISESIGGTLSAEDLGSGMAKSYSTALMSPGKYISADENKNFETSALMTVTPLEQVANATSAGVQVFNTAISDVENKFEGLSKALGGAINSVTEFSAEHDKLTTALVATGATGLLALKGHSVFKIFSGFKSIITGRGTVSSVAAETIRPAASRLSRVGGFLGRLGGRAFAPLALYEASQDAPLVQFQSRDEKRAELERKLNRPLTPDEMHMTQGMTGLKDVRNEISGWWNNWFGDKPETVARTEANIDRVTTAQLPPAGRAGDAAAPVVGITPPQIIIQALSASPEDIGAAVAAAFRDASPGLLQQMEYALDVLMQTKDYSRPD